MAKQKFKRTIKRFTASGITKTTIPKLTRKQVFAKTKRLVFNPKALRQASRKGQVF